MLGRLSILIADKVSSKNVFGDGSVPIRRNPIRRNANPNPITKP